MTLHITRYSMIHSFLSSLIEHMAQWSDEDKRGVWIKVPVQQSWVVAELYSRDFELHHAKLDYIMMKKWLQMDVEDKMPRYAFHTVGVSGTFLNCFSSIGSMNGRKLQ